MTPGKSMQLGLERWPKPPSRRWTSPRRSEMNPDFRWFVAEISKLGPRAGALQPPISCQQEVPRLAEFFRQHGWSSELPAFYRRSQIDSSAATRVRDSIRA
jgi:hypothetical protein